MVGFYSCEGTVHCEAKCETVSIDCLNGEWYTFTDREDSQSPECHWDSLKSKGEFGRLCSQRCPHVETTWPSWNWSCDQSTYNNMKCYGRCKWNESLLVEARCNRNGDWIGNPSLEESEEACKEMQCSHHMFNPSNGTLHCGKDESDYTICILDCNFGFVPQSEDMVICKDDQWKTLFGKLVEDLTCERPVAVLVGGKLVIFVSICFYNCHAKSWISKFLFQSDPFTIHTKA